jgi:hypothetical protein
MSNQAWLVSIPRAGGMTTAGRAGGAIMRSSKGANIRQQSGPWFVDTASGDDLAVEGAELIGKMAVEADAGLAAISGVDLRRGETVAAGLEELPVR